MLLVGSRALQTYIPLNRVLHDWDIWMSDYEYNKFLVKNLQYKVKETPSSTLFDIDNIVVEVKPESKFEPTDKLIWENAMFTDKKVDTPYGSCRVPDIQDIYDMKLATSNCLPEWKHIYDKNLIEQRYVVKWGTPLFLERLNETRARVEEQKKNKHSFFHRNKYNDEAIATIPEYIAHDRLHEMISDLIGLTVPTYVRMINGDVEIDIEAFRKLTYVQKVNLMVEESLVLALERWFIPQMVERGINYRLIDKFYSNNEASGSYLLLLHTNITGLKGEHPEIVQFGRDNFNTIEKRWIIAKDEIKANGGFPRHFFDEIFELRDKYRKGEKVGLHHES